MDLSFISLRSCLILLKLFILSKIYLSLFSSLFISFQVTLWWSVPIYFCHNTFLVSYHLLLISTPFHLRLIYMSLYQVLQIFDKSLSILAKILCHITLGYSLLIRFWSAYWFNSDSLAVKILWFWWLNSRNFAILMETLQFGIRISKYTQ